MLNIVNTNKYYLPTYSFISCLIFSRVTSINRNFISSFLLNFKLFFKGFEPYAFMHAKKLFDSIEIPIIFMEWLNLPKQSDAHKEIKDMIDFLSSFKLKPYANKNFLEINKYLTWPSDIIWRKDGY